MGTLVQFEKELDQFEQQAALEHSEVTRRLAILLFTKIVARTPYATGQARSSWQIAIGIKNPAVNVKGHYPQYANPAAAAALAHAEATAKLAGYTYSVFGAKPTIWITNHLRYIPFLERGTSKKAPGGMVALSIAEVKNNFAQIAHATQVGQVNIAVT